MMGLGTILGAWLAADWQAFSGANAVYAVVAAWTVALLGAAGNAWNDVCDVETDAVNRPSRPIVAGLVSVKQAILFAVTLCILAFLLAIWLGKTHVQIVLVVTILLGAYSRWLKAIPIVGNVLVALLVSAAILFGAVLFEISVDVWYGIVFAFLTNLARELVKDLADLPGDEAAGLRTLAWYRKGKVSIIMAGILIVGIVIFSVAPSLISGREGVFLLLMVVADLFLVRALWLVSCKKWNSGETTLKFAMIAGMGALVLMVVT